MVPQPGHHRQAAVVARDALARALEGGHLVAVPRLVELAEPARWLQVEA